MNEAQSAYDLFRYLHGVAFSWTGQAASFTTQADAEAFKAQFPGWTVYGGEQ